MCYGMINVGNLPYDLHNIIKIGIANHIIDSNFCKNLQMKMHLCKNIRISIAIRTQFANKFPTSVTHKFRYESELGRTENFSELELDKIIFQFRTRTLTLTKSSNISN